MREAVVEAKLAVGETRDAVARTERDLTQERQRLADAERRGRLASEIQDRETVEVAQRFAAKHRGRAEVLAKKLAALQGELALYERELGDMQAQLGRAERDRPLTEDERGPKRRTNVFVQGRAEPIIASRTEQSILEDMGATGEGFQVQALREAITELLAAFHEFSPALRRALQSEHHVDVEQWEQRLGELLRAPQRSEPVEQNDLFE